MRILLDMDEVLADFIGAACRTYGTSREEVLRFWPAGRWCMRLPLSRALGHAAEMTQAEFESKFACDPHWWENEVKPMPWLADLLCLVDRFTDDWEIVTAPTLENWDPAVCAAGKIRWIRHYISSAKFPIVHPHKHLLAGPGVILVDDREENVQKFVAAGGGGIVFPAHHNKLHALANDPLPYVKKSLQLRSPTCT